MPDHIVPASQSNAQVALSQPAWGEHTPLIAAPPTSAIHRALNALRRYKWLMLLLFLASVVSGVVATRLITPQYEVGASIVIASDGPMESRTGPIRSSGLLSADDWNNLLKSFSVTDAVVRKLALYLRPDNYALDHELFAGFTLTGKFVPGRYELLLDQVNKRWSLRLKSTNAELERGVAADSVGRKIGFGWVLPAWSFNGTGTRKVGFTVYTPREVSATLIDRLVTARPRESNFLRLTLRDSDPKLASDILNAWVDEFVGVAAQLKRRKLLDFAQTLESQLQTAKGSLDGSEMQLSSFRVQTITQPSEGGPIAAGVQETRDPVIKAYFDKKIEYDEIKHDVQVVESLLASSRDSIPNEALLQIRSVASTNEAVGQELRNAIADLHVAESSLAQARLAYTEQHPVVRNIVAQITKIRRERIPQDARALLASLKTRELADSTRIAGASENLQRIPQRTIEEERLRRIRDISSGLYTNLQNRYSEAKLAEASASPDVTVLDSAIAPLAPTANTAPTILLMAVLGGAGAAVGLALLLDHLDGRLRYPAQVSDDLNLSIVGTVPEFPKGGIDQNSPVTYQLVESFRTLRMAIMHGLSGHHTSFAISSPSPGEGKSLIAANLAMSFAEAGYRTVLVDGDTRRGALHEMFGLAPTPGLTEYLQEAATLDVTVRETSHSGLSVINCGSRMRNSPELLTSARLPHLVAELQKRFDVVVFDTPPLAAGIDGYSISVATGALLIVLRVGHTTRRTAAEKLRMVDRLPIDLLGAVLNGIKLNGEYADYGYAAGYEAGTVPAGRAVVTQR